MKLALVIFLSIILSLKSFSQMDTLDGCKATARKFEISDKVVMCSNDLIIKAIKNKLKFTNCILNTRSIQQPNGKGFNSVPHFSLNNLTAENWLTFENCKLNFMFHSYKLTQPINKNCGLFFSADTLSGLSFSDSRIKNLEVTDNYFTNGSIGAENSKFEDVQIFSNNYKKRGVYAGNISFRKSSIYNIEIGQHNWDISFEKDSLINYVYVCSRNKEISFLDCDFSCSNIHLESDSANSVHLNNCSFLNPVTKLSLTGNIISLTNCKNISGRIDLDVNPDMYKDSIYLYLEGTDIERIRFNYSPGIILKFYDSAGDDNITNVYEAVINSFQKQGKYNAVEHFDIQYKKWKYSQLFWGSFGNFWDNVWWRYGYQKERIMLWTIGLLLFFYIFNLLLWNQFLLTYTIAGKWKYVNNWNKSIVALVVTVYIFFSLKVDFDKLKYHNTWMLLYFFIQYAVGLLCLFFIFTFILKS